MDSGVQKQDGATDARARATEEYRTYATFFHTLRNAHNRVVLGIDVIVNKPMDEVERGQRIAKLQEAAREVTELLDRAPVPRAP